MINYGKVRSTIKPEPIVIDEFSVWQHTNIQPVSEMLVKKMNSWALNTK